VGDRARAALEEAVLRFGKAPSAVAGAFGAAIVVQITIVAFYLLTAQRAISSASNPAGRGAHSGEPRGPDGADLD
jgi:hypothetical protein